MNATILKVLKILIALIAAVAASFLIAIIATGDDAIVEGKGTLGIVVGFCSNLSYFFIFHNHTVSQTNNSFTHGCL